MRPGAIFSRSTMIVLGIAAVGTAGAVARQAGEDPDVIMEMMDAQGNSVGQVRIG